MSNGVFSYRLWRSSCGCDANTIDCCNAAARATTNGVSSTVATLLDTLPMTIQTCAEAMDHYAEQLRRRLGAVAMTVTSSSDTAFGWSTKLPSGKTLTVSLTPTGGCRYPITISYTCGAKTNSATFQTMDAVISWLVHETA